MSRALIVIWSDADRTRAAEWCKRAPVGSRIEFKAPKRTLPQNDRMWSMLTDVATQKEHHGRKYDAARWKIIFMAALGSEIEFIPSLDGQTFIPCNGRSSDLSKDEMSNLIEFIAAWGAENGVVFHGPEEPPPLTEDLRAPRKQAEHTREV